MQKRVTKVIICCGETLGPRSMMGFKYEAKN